MTQEYIESVVLDDPLGEARKSVIGEPPADSDDAAAQPAPTDDDDEGVASGYSWLS